MGTAFDAKKRIIPYLIHSIDDVPLPDALENFVYVEQSDKEHSHAELLRAIFGKLPEQPKAIDLFPGHWDAEIDIPDGNGNKGLYELELRPNGQVSGLIRMKSAGTMGWAVQQAGLMGINLDFMFQPSPVRGKWSYRSGNELRLDLVCYAYGREFPLSLQVFTTGSSQNVLRGTIAEGAHFTFRRKKCG